MGHGKHEEGIHAYLITQDIETDITEEGIGIYQPEDPWKDPEARTLYIFPYQYSALSWEKAEALQIAGVRMDKRDLWRCALEMKPVGLVCTTYVQVLLGMLPERYKPMEVLEDVMNVYPYGHLWMRDTNNEWKEQELPPYE